MANFEAFPQSIKLSANLFFLKSAERADERDENNNTIPPLETLDIFDNFDGKEIELMFSEDYGEDNKDENKD